MAIGWKFSRSSTDEGRSGGNPSEYAFDHDLTDFVRETLQNSNDAGYRVSGSTEVTYKLRELTGDDLRQFLRHLQWESEDASEESLKDHIDAAAKANTEASLHHVYEEIENEGRLVVVTVVDRNTHGLYGPEGGTGPFSALVLDELITEKKSGSSPTGSYGLGKAVLWSWSGLKTVIFNSVIETPDVGEDPTNEHDSPRFIARTQLPSHEAESEKYRFEGRGLLGSLDGSRMSTAVGGEHGSTIYKWGGGGRPYSAWGEEAAELAKKLGLDRPNETPGTSVSVVGFCEPGGDSQPSLDEIGEEIAEEASKWFWPAMLRGDLEVTVDIGNADSTEVEPDTCSDVKHFVRCVQNRNNTRDVLEQPGDIGVATPHFEIEDKSEMDLEDEEDDPETESGPIAVYVRLADPDRSGKLANKVALIRGGGMVVKYYDRNRIVYGGRDFHGVVLAGTARPWTDNEPTQADRDIDEYLRAAEPPRHDDWEYTKNLKSKYRSGTKSSVEGLQRQIVTDAIKNLVRETREEGRLVAGRLADRLNIPEGRGNDRRGGNQESTSGPQVFDGTSELSYDSSDDRWKFSGFAQILVGEYEAWEATVTLHKLDEEGNIVGTIPVSYLETTPDDLYGENQGDRYLIRGGPDVENFRFRGTSATRPSRGETKINVKGRVFVTRGIR